MDVSAIKAEYEINISNEEKDNHTKIDAIEAMRDASVAPSVTLTFNSVHIDEKYKGKRYGYGFKTKSSSTRASSANGVTNIYLNYTGPTPTKSFCCKF